MSKDSKYLHPEDAKKLKKNQNLAKFISTEAIYKFATKNFNQEEWLEGL